MRAADVVALAVCGDLSYQVFQLARGEGPGCLLDLLEPRGVCGLGVVCQPVGSLSDLGFELFEWCDEGGVGDLLRRDDEAGDQVRLAA
jgi:hypothetical protein